MSETSPGPNRDAAADPPTAGADPRATDAGAPPHTSDLVIDAALADLAAVPAEDLDGLLRAGSEVESVLRGRLGDLQGQGE